MTTEHYRGVNIMFHPIKQKWYYYTEYTKGAKYFKTYEAAQESVDKLTK